MELTCLLADDLDTSESRECADKHCHFGAVCQMTVGIQSGPTAGPLRGPTTDLARAECVCPVTCDVAGPDRRSAAEVMVCGTDGQTYGSACQLQLSACRLQKNIKIVHVGACIGEDFLCIRIVNYRLLLTEPVLMYCLY